MTPFMMLRGGAPQKYPKKGGGRSLAKIKKSAIQNVDYFEMRGGGPDFQVFPKFKWLKYGPEFDAICV